MTVKTFQSLVGPETHGIRYAPNLTYPKDKLDGQSVVFIVTNQVINGGGLQTLLSLTGKWMVYQFQVSSLIVDIVDDIKLTIDGVVIWDIEPIANATGENYIAHPVNFTEPVICNSSFLFEMEGLDNDVDINYMARPIL